MSVKIQLTKYVIKLADSYLGERDGLVNSPKEAMFFEEIKDAAEYATACTSPALVGLKATVKKVTLEFGD